MVDLTSNYKLTTATMGDTTDMNWTNNTDGGSEIQTDFDNVLSEITHTPPHENEDINSVENPPFSSTVPIIHEKSIQSSPERSVVDLVADDDEMNTNENRPQSSVNVEETSQSSKRTERSVLLIESDDPNDKNDYTQLAELFVDWNLLCMLPAFIAHKITVELLHDLERDHINTIFKNFPVGYQIQFQKSLKMWQNKQTTQPNDLQCKNNNNVRDNVPDNNVPGNVPDNNVPASSRVLPKPILNVEIPFLSQILDDVNGQGAMIKSYYKQHNNLNETARECLITLVVNAYIQKNIHMSTSIANNIADEIVNTFQSEAKETYFMAQKNGGPKGRLYNKYQRVKSKVTKGGLVESKQTPATPNAVVRKIVQNNENDGEETRLFLQNHRDPWKDIKTAWRSCKNYRINEIQNSKDSDLKTIFQRWPLLKHSLGCSLMEDDFNEMYPKAGDLLFEWAKYSKVIIACMSSRVKDKSSLDILKIVEENSNLSEDGSNAAILWLLHATMLPTSKVVSKSADGKPNTIKFSIRDGQTSMIMVVRSVDELDQKIKTYEQKMEPIHLSF